MARTLIYTVQRVLEKLNLDPVNSISDTEDAMLVAREAETTYFDLISRADWPHTEKAFPIEPGYATGAHPPEAAPTLFWIPENVIKINSLMYRVGADPTVPQEDWKLSYKKIEWLEPSEFIELSNTRDSSSDNVSIVAGQLDRWINSLTLPYSSRVEGASLNIYTDRAPTYYTSFDNTSLVLDSFDKTLADTLPPFFLEGFGYYLPTWLPEDSFKIPLEEKLYPLYLSALTSACSVQLLSTQNIEEERRQMRGISRLRREAYTTEAEYYPTFKYGRNGNGLA